MSAQAYSELASQFEAYFASVKKSFPGRPENLYQPVAYFLGLDAKRIRPLFVLIAAECFGKDIAAAQPAAAAVELFHNFSLIHDDIMDKAPLRRGKETVHQKWNSNIAILSGDVLLVKAYQQLALCKNALRLQAIFSETAIAVCEGQQFDMDYEQREQVGVEEYLEMIRLKTAVLLAASLQVGALCGGASEAQALKYFAAGEQLGLAFQLTDDYLDVFGDAGKTGKQEGGDILANKKTWLLIRSLELAEGPQKKVLVDWLTRKEFDPAEKVRAVKQIFSALGLPGLLQREIGARYADACALLREGGPEPAKTEAFIEFLENLMRREK
jgi:geranylgeranyl diphosphate synthase, type II